MLDSVIYARSVISILEKLGKEGAATGCTERPGRVIHA